MSSPLNVHLPCSCNPKVILYLPDQSLVVGTKLQVSSSLCVFVYIHMENCWVEKL